MFWWQNVGNAMSVKMNYFWLGQNMKMQCV